MKGEFIVKFLSIIFFVSAVLSAVLAVLAFIGVLPKKGKNTGIALVIASGIFGFCELICIWDSPKGLILVTGGVLLVNLLYIIAGNERE